MRTILVFLLVTGVALGAEDPRCAKSDTNGQYYCMSCSMNDGCNFCQGGTVVNGECTPGITITNCQVTTSTGVCGFCNTGYSLTGAGVCFANPSTGIPTGCAMVSSAGKCIACESGLFPDNDTAQTPAGLTTQDDIKACYPSTNYPELTNCKMIETIRATGDWTQFPPADLRCLRCKETHYKSTVTGSCEPATGVFQNCIFGDGSRCNNCNIGFKQTEYGGNCIEVQQGPIVCGSGLMMNEDQSKCVPEDSFLLSVAFFASFLVFSIF